MLATGMNETLFLILTGTLSAIAAWIIINAIKYMYRVITEFINDAKRMKKDIEELKIRVINIEAKLGDKE